MSAYHGYDTEFIDKNCLVGALQEMGYKPNVYDIPMQLEGYHGDKRQQRAEIIIPRRQVGRASNDVGFHKQANGKYQAIISEYDSHSHFNDAEMSELKRQYGVQFALAQCKKKGYRNAKIERKIVNGRPKTVITAEAR